MGLENYIIHGENLKKIFTLNFQKGQIIKAVDGVNITVKKGETLGLAGESGCGKTTIAKLLLGLYRPTEGNVFIENNLDIWNLKGEEIRNFRKKYQIIFQNPYGSLNPRFTVLETLKEPLDIHNMGTKKDKLEIIKTVIKQVGLDMPEDFINSYPHELSGGQRQRISIARAIILKPAFIIGDEAVSMLDSSTKAGIVKLLQQLISELNLAFLFISHDLSMMRYLCKNIAIMYRGRIVELGPTDEILKNHLHPYTQALLDNYHFWNQTKTYPLEMNLHDTSNDVNITHGCSFYLHCPRRLKSCRHIPPVPVAIANDYLVECNLYNNNMNKYTSV